MIVVTFTSWKGRINNCPKVIESIINQTHIPDRVYLVLAEDEFIDRVIPKELSDMIDGELVQIKWVKRNTRTMKKVFPILDDLDDDDIIIYTDDDIILPPDLIETRLSQFEDHGPITGNIYSHKQFDGEYIPISSPTSVIQKKMLKGYKDFVDEEVIQTYEDDLVYTALLYMNGYTFTMCDKLDAIDLQKNSSINPINPARDGLYNTKATLEVLNRKLKEIE